MSVTAVAPDIYDDPTQYPTDQKKTDALPLPQPIPLAQPATPSPTLTLPGGSTQPPSTPTVPAATPVPTSTPDPLAFAPSATPDPVIPPTQQFQPSPVPLAPTATPDPVIPPTATFSPSTPAAPAPAPASAPIVSGATEAARTPTTGGVTEYGKVWVPGSEPPAGLSDTAYQEWQQNNPQDVGWSQGGWDYLHQQAAIDTSTDAGMQQANDLAATQAASPGPIPTQDQPNYLPGGSAAGGATSAPGVQPIIPPSGPVAVPDPAVIPIAQFTPSTPTTPSVPGAVSAPTVNTTTAASQFSVPAPVAAPAPVTVPASLPSATPAGSAHTDANGLPIPTSAGGSSYSLTPTTDANSLTNQTITPGSGVDRFAIAQSRLKDFTANAALQYKADLDQANRYGAGAGVIGSGGLNTTFGNIADTHARSLQSEQDTLFNDALENSIGDAYKNIGIAQQQQQFQSSEQAKLFGQNVTAQQLRDTEQGQQFAQQMAAAGFNAAQIEQAFQNAADQQKTAFSQQVAVQQLMDSEQGQQWAEQLQAAGFNVQQIQQAFENAVTTQKLSDSETAQQFYQAYEQYVAGTSGNPVDYETWLAAQYAKKAA